MNAPVTELRAEKSTEKPIYTSVPTLGTVFNHSERGEMVDLEIVHGQWLCVWCKEPQRYTTINGYCVIGCGRSTTSFGGKTVEACSKPECAEATRRFLHG